MYAMFTAFVLTGTGLVLGIAYCLFVVFVLHHTLETVLGPTIPYFKAVGGMGILGMLCFFIFLVSEIINKPNGNPKA